MSYIRFQFDQIQYIQFEKNCPNEVVKFICKKFNKELNEGEVENPIVSVQYSTTITDYWFPPQKTIKISMFETDKPCFKIQYKYNPRLLPELISNCIAASYILKKEYLLIHGMLLNNGEVIYGQPYSGKSTLAKTLTGDIKAICDDQVLVDLKNNLVYPLPFFFFDYSSLFYNVPIDIKPYSIKTIKPINDKQNLFRCSAMFLYQPFAIRENIFTCDEKIKWSNFQEGFKNRVEQRIQQLINKYKL